MLGYCQTHGAEGGTRSCMRTDMTKELAEHVVDYAKVVCNEGNHSQILVFTEIARQLNAELNRMSGLDTARNQ